MFTHNDIIRATGARALDSIGSVRGVSTDTRTLQPGDLYVALRGNKYDGHQFVRQAMHKDAAGVVADCEMDVQLPQYIVDDTLLALQALAKYHRDRFDIPVIGITGTNGKTTVKEIVCRILAVDFEPASSERNYNNHIGVPMTLLKLRDEHTHAVVEMGMNHLGEIKVLSGIAQPTVGVVTNIGHGHLEHLGTIEAVAQAKSEIFDGMLRGSVAVLPTEGESTAVLRTAATSHGMKIVTFGTAETADVCFSVTRADLHGIVGTLCTPKGHKVVTVRLLGRHNALNIAAAVAAAMAAEPALKFDHVVEAVESMEQVEMRCQMEDVKGVTVIADCYNANLDSVRAALRILADAEAQGRRLALLGDMKELGACAPQCHRDAGAAAAKANLSMLVAVGEHAQDIICGAREAGMPDSALMTAKDVAAAAAYLNDVIKPGDCVLVKGSRSVRLEDAIETWRAARGSRRA